MVERELYVGPLSVVKEIRFDNPDDVGGKGGGENVYSGFVRQFWKDLSQVSIQRPESGDAVTIQTRKKQFVSFINEHMFDRTETGVI